MHQNNIELQGLDGKGFGTVLQQSFSPEGTPLAPAESEEGAHEAAHDEALRGILEGGGGAAGGRTGAGGASNAQRARAGSGLRLGLGGSNATPNRGLHAGGANAGGGGGGPNSNATPTPGGNLGGGGHGKHDTSHPLYGHPAFAARARDVAQASTDVDLFYERVYQYYREGGLGCIAAERLRAVATLGPSKVPRNT